MCDPVCDLEGALASRSHMGSVVLVCCNCRPHTKLGTPLCFLIPSRLPISELPHCPCLLLCLSQLLLEDLQRAVTSAALPCVLGSDPFVPALGCQPGQMSPQLPKSV